MSKRAAAPYPPDAGEAVAGSPCRRRSVRTAHRGFGGSSNGRWTHPPGTAMLVLAARCADAGERGPGEQERQAACSRRPRQVSTVDPESPAEIPFVPEKP